MEALSPRAPSLSPPLPRGPLRCAFKVDIQMVYDTVDCKFLRAILCHFGFHSVMLDWIMKCVSTISFSNDVNGMVQGYFKVISDALEEFKCSSGLIPSLPDSTIFFANVSHVAKNQIMQIMSFEEGELGSVHKLHIYTRPLFDDDKKGKNNDTEDLRLVEPCNQLGKIVGLILELIRQTYEKRSDMETQGKTSNANTHVESNGVLPPLMTAIATQDHTEAGDASNEVAQISTSDTNANVNANANANTNTMPMPTQN
ncbi:hypothetical protein Tco_1067174 [Tanacetum coccineum]|uniref:Reverse transcriptase domain-containing protein n=1 Tax=Tanacetum coccineum TaxID=301880 RepID=A0ABQ5HC57_9ASTR